MNTPNHSLVTLGLGSNLGDAYLHLQTAIKNIIQLPNTSLHQCSAFFQSAPIDAQGNDFINAVIQIHTTLTPLTLLTKLQDIEHQAGRTRPYRNAPRTLDIDILLIDQEIIDTPALQVPHPRMLERAFVLIPLLEMMPHIIHPIVGELSSSIQKLSHQRLHRIQPRFNLNSALDH
jgi:2-amino-4-hydroxy-6-hydroxymethyldihydropteridine diphosphokinase